MNEMKTLGRNLRRLRLSSGLTQKELDLKVGLTKGTVSQLELGKQGDIKMKYLYLICRILKVDIEQLFMDPQMLPINFIVSNSNVRALEKIFSRVKEILAQKEK